VCVVTETYPPEVNGVALSLARLVDGLRARAHRVSIVRPRQPGGDGAVDGAGPDVALVRGFPLPGYRGLQFGVSPWGCLAARWKRDRPDVVYVATEGPLGWSAVRTGRRLSIPVLSGFHTNFHTYVRHYRARWLTPLVLRYLRRLHNDTWSTLVATDDLRLQLHGLGFERLAVLGRGVDGELFRPDRRSEALRRSWGVGPDDLVVAHVGRLAPEKNVGLVIRAYRAMVREGAPVRRLVLVGDGPLRSALERAHPDVRFCGLQLGQDLAAHYASADLFLFPSETETFGNVTLEAMASGLAIVAYDYAAARMHITPGLNGAVVPCGRPEAFVAVAVSLGRRPDTLREMGRHARARAVLLDWAGVIGRFEKLLAEAAVSGRQPWLRPRRLGVA